MFYLFFPIHHSTILKLMMYSQAYVFLVEAFSLNLRVNRFSIVSLDVVTESTKKNQQTCAQKWRNCRKNDGKWKAETQFSAKLFVVKSRLLSYSRTINASPFMTSTPRRPCTFSSSPKSPYRNSPKVSREKEKRCYAKLVRKDIHRASLRFQFQSGNEGVLPKGK